jgi:hypothetical protein
MGEHLHECMEKHDAHAGYSAGLTQARVQGLHDSLRSAADSGDLDAVRKLIANGADVEDDHSSSYNVS